MIPISDYPLNYLSMCMDLQKAHPQVTNGHTVELLVELSAFRVKVAEIAKDYLNSYPGADNLRRNVVIHSAAKECIQGRIEDHGKLMWLMQCLEYRNGLVLLADQYVTLVCSSNFAICAEWRPDTLPTQVAGIQPDVDAYNDLIAQIHLYQLFPSPALAEEQGFCWTKPRNYLAAAFLASDFNSDQAEQKLQELEP